MDLQYIINEINENLGIDILDKKRKREYVYGRFLYMRLAKDLNPHLSLTAIGNTLKQNHATVIHGLEMFENIIRFKIEPELIDLHLKLLTKLKQLKNLNETGFNRTEMILINIKPLQKYYGKPIL